MRSDAIVGERMSLFRSLAIAVVLLAAGCTTTKMPPPGVSGRPRPRDEKSPGEREAIVEQPLEHAPVEGLPLPFAGKKRHAQKRDDAADTEDAPADGEEGAYFETE